MKAEVDILINAPREKVWSIITDIDGSMNTISGIEAVEVLDRPAEGLVGLKWKETRTLFGRTATEIMWITEVDENRSYNTRAESHGAIYKTQLVLADADDKTRLSMTFNGEPQSFGAKIMSAITGPFFNNATKQALIQDLEDIKAAAESGSPM